MTAPTSGTVREARDRFMQTWGFTPGEYTARTFPLHLSKRIVVQVPNVGVLHIHDLHHAATGYPSGFTGEAQICAWELRSGIGMWQVSPFVFGGLCIGLVRTPRAVITAWQAAKGARNLYRERRHMDYDAILDQPLSVLRQYLGIPPEGYAPKETV